MNELLELVHLEQFADRYPVQLSGGQRQRMALARALAVEPEVLLLDEPFGALDAQVRKELRTWLRRLHDEVHVTTVFVTHDQEEAMDVADRIVVMADGTVEQVGTPDELYDRPANDFVMSFLGPVTRLAGDAGAPARPRDRARAGRRCGTGTVVRVVTLGFEVRVDIATADGETWVQLTRAEADRLDLQSGARVGVRAVHEPTTEVPADATVEPALDGLGG